MSSIQSKIRSKINAREQNYIAEDLGVKFMSDVPNIRVAVGVAVGVVLTATHTATVISELYYTGPILPT